MPSPFSSSFASAAAGSNANGRDSNNDWYALEKTNSQRRDGAIADCNVPDRSRRVNGATQTFRRSSTTNNPAQREASQTAMGQMGSAGLHGFQSATSRNPSKIEGRYSRDQLLDIYRAQVSNGRSNVNMNDLFLEWNPKSSDHTTNGELREDVMGADLCWDNTASSHPLGLVDLRDEENEVGCTSIHSVTNA